MARSTSFRIKRTKPTKGKRAQYYMNIHSYDGRRNILATTEAVHNKKDIGTTKDALMHAVRMELPELSAAEALWAFKDFFPGSTITEDMVQAFIAAQALRDPREAWEKKVVSYQEWFEIQKTT